MDDAVELRGPLSPALRLHDRRFYSGVSIAAAAVVFAGFGRSYYLRSFADAAALTPLVHMHGAIFSAWLILFVVQVRLIAGRKTPAHRQLGYAMAGLAVAMLVVGLLTVVAGARRGHTVTGVTPEAFMLGGLTNLAVFATLVTLAIAFRKRSAVHKRLMMLGVTGGLLLPAIDACRGLTSIRRSDCCSSSCSWPAVRSTTGGRGGTFTPLTSGSRWACSSLFL